MRRRWLGALAGAVLSTILIVNPTLAVTIRPSGDWRASSDLICGTGVVAESLPIVTDATPGQIAWQISVIYRFNWATRAWDFDQYSDWRYSTVSGYGTTTNIWTQYPSGNVIESKTYSVAPGGIYFLYQWVYVNGGWYGRYAVHATGLRYCQA